MNGDLLKVEVSELTLASEELKNTQCLECRQIYVQIYIAMCRRGRE